MLVLYLSTKLLVFNSNQRFVSLASKLSVLGIALAVATMITVFSVIDGFKQDIQQMIDQQGQTVYLSDLWNQDLEQFSESLSHLPYVNTVSQYVQGYGLIKLHRNYYPLLVSAFSDQNFQDAEHGVLIDQAMANLHDQGEVVSLVFPGHSRLPKELKMKVEGKFENQVVLPKGLWHVQIDIKQFENLGVGHHGRGMRVDLNRSEDVYQLRAFLDQAQPKLFSIHDWVSQFGPFLDALGLQQQAMMMVLFLIVVVSLFSLTSGLMMLVHHKHKQIVMLRVLGVSASSIVWMIVLQGIWASLIGSVIGYGLGYLLSINAAQLVASLERLFNLTLIHVDVYGVKELPIHISHDANLLICAVTVFLGMVASLLPGLRLRHLNPAEVLRNG